MNKKFIIGLTVIGLMVGLGRLLAAGISVTPDKLSVQTYVKGEASRDLYVKNISQGPVIYNLYAEELADAINIQPDFVRLEPAETQRIKITIKPREIGVFITNIAVVAQELDRRQFNASAGVKIPLDLRVNAAPKTIFSELGFWGIIGGVFSIIALASIIMIIRKKRLPLWRRLFKR